MATPSWINLRDSANSGAASGSHNSGGSNSNNRREMEKFYDQAFRTYCEINDFRRGARSCMWAWTSHCSLGHSFNNDMISNVLLRAGPQRSPMIRKYAFHLILAGHLYKECEQREHCYSRAMMVYAERGWAHIEDHINYNLGRYDAAIDYFLELLCAGRRSQARQKSCGQIC